MKCCVKCHEQKDESAFMFRYDRGKKRARERTCKNCRKTRNRNRDREAEHARASAKVGKIYLPRDIRYPWWKNIAVGYGRAVNLDAHGWRSRRETIKEYWIRRLRTDLPSLYDPTKQVDTLAYRGRYNLDPAFKAQEIERTLRRRSEESGAEMFSDGSLDGATVQRLFAEAETCPYCGEWMHSREKTLDHVWPRQQGGWHSVANVVVCCSSCNSGKSDTHPLVWLRRRSIERQIHIRSVWRAIGIRNVEQPCLVP